MDYTAEQINNAFSKISPELSRAMLEINLDSKIQEISKKYNLNEEQKNNFTLYVTFVIIELITNEDFEKKIFKEMGLSEEISKNIISNTKELVFESIKKQIQSIKEAGDFVSKIKLPEFDPRFNNESKELQKIIAYSGWKEILHEISNKYKISIDKIGLLEEEVSKVMLGNINPNEFENDLRKKIGLSEDENQNLASNIDEQILKTIKTSLRETGYKLKEIDEDIVPLPPYFSKINTVSSIKNDFNQIKPVSVTIKTEPDSYREIVDEVKPAQTEIKTVINDIYKESGIEMIEEKNMTETPKIKLEQPEYKEEKFIMPSGINMLKEKLGSATTTGNKVNNYSLPKINSGVNTNPAPLIAVNINAHDPYHEAI